MKCENCVINGGQYFCEELNRPLPDNNGPHRPTDCPIPEETTSTCEVKSPPPEQYQSEA